MRKLFAFFYIVCILVALAWLGAPPAVVWLAKRSVQRVLPGVRLDIRRCALLPPWICRFDGVEIRRADMYRVSVPSITAAAGIFGTIRVADFRIDVQAGAIKTQATASVLLGSWGKSIRAFSLNVPELQFPAGKASGISVTAAAQRSGSLRIEKLSIGKLSVNDITADTILDADTFRLENVSARVLGGRLGGNAQVVLRQGAPYQATIDISDIDLAVLIDDFRLGQKLQLSGVVKGAAAVQGAAEGFGLVSAEVRAVPPGGVLNIRDEAVIDIIASRSGQARDLISRSFTDYRYDDGCARLHTEQNKLVLDVSFQGQNGRRNVQAVLHDFTVQGGGA